MLPWEMRVVERRVTDYCIELCNALFIVMFFPHINVTVAVYIYMANNHEPAGRPVQYNDVTAGRLSRLLGFRL